MCSTQRGAQIAYHDPYVAELPSRELRSAPLDEIRNSDAIVLVTAHPDLPYPDIVNTARLFVDLRGITRAGGGRYRHVRSVCRLEDAAELCEPHGRAAAVFVDLELDLGCLLVAADPSWPQGLTNLRDRLKMIATSRDD